MSLTVCCSGCAFHCLEILCFFQLRQLFRRPREHADFAHRLCSAASQHAPEAPSLRDEWRRRLSQLTGFVELGPASPACSSRWPQDTCAARSEGAARLELGSVSPQTSLWPSMLTRPAFGHDDSQVPWPYAPWNQQLSLLGWCRVVRLQILFHLALVRAHEHTPGDTWRSLPRLTVRSRIIIIDETCCKMLPPLERARWPLNPMVQPHARVYRARQQGSAGNNLQGRARQGVARSQRPARRHCQHRPEHRRLAQPSHGMDPRRVAGDRDDASQHSSMVRHRLHRCQAGRRPRFLPHRATSQARSSSITAAVWRWSSADANSASDRLKQTEDEELLIHTFPSVDPPTVSTRDAALDLNCADGSTQGGSMATGFTASELKQRG